MGDSVKKSDTLGTAPPMRKRSKKAGGADDDLSAARELVPSWKTAYMFLVWCDSQNLEYVARQCNVAVTTARRYRDLHNWETKRQMILKDIQLQEGEGSEKDAKRRSLQQVRILKNQAFEATLREGYKDGKDASNAFERFQRLESQLLGEGGGTTINLIMIAAEQFQKAQAKLGVSKKVDAQIVSVEDSGNVEQE